MPRKKIFLLMGGKQTIAGRLGAIGVTWIFMLPGTSLTSIYIRERKRLFENASIFGIEQDRSLLMWPFFFDLYLRQGRARVLIKSPIFGPKAEVAAVLLIPFIIPTRST